MTEITLDEKILVLTKEVWRRLELKEKVVAKGQMSREDAQRACDVMQAVLRDYLGLSEGTDNRGADRPVEDLR